MQRRIVPSVYVVVDRVSFPMDQSTIRHFRCCIIIENRHRKSFNMIVHVKQKVAVVVDVAVASSFVVATFSGVAVWFQPTGRWPLVLPLLLFLVLLYGFNPQ